MARVKICGLFRSEDIKYVNLLKPDYIGFVFYPKSHRNVSANMAAFLKAKLEPSIKAVGVFVNNDKNLVANLAHNGIIDFVQLHGSENAQYITALKQLTDKPIIKAVKVKSRQDITEAEKLPCDYLLLDSGMGTGTTFDWSEIGQVNKPFFMAGGLSCQNIEKAMKTEGVYAFDVSSGVETDNVKDKQKIEEFIKIVRRTQNV